MSVKRPKRPRLRVRLASISQRTQLLVFLTVVVVVVVAVVIIVAAAACKHVSQFIAISAAAKNRSSS